MIIREWRGRAGRATQDRYPAHFKSNVLPHLKRIDGFLGAELLKRERENDVEYLVLTRWQSLEAIRAFAGSFYDKAVVEPEAMAALTSFDADVRHYEVIEKV